VQLLDDLQLQPELPRRVVGEQDILDLAGVEALYTNFCSGDEAINVRHLDVEKFVPGKRLMTVTDKKDPDREEQEPGDDKAT
jgi:hypothetical protein